MISCYGGASEAVNARIGSVCVEEVQGVKWCVGWEAGFTFEVTEEDLSVLCYTSLVILL